MRRGRRGHADSLRELAAPQLVLAVAIGAVIAALSTSVLRSLDARGTAAPAAAENRAEAVAG